MKQFMFKPLLPCCLLATSVRLSNLDAHEAVHVLREHKFTTFIYAPAKIRTWNNCFEGRYDIHFTTGASPYCSVKVHKYPTDFIGSC